MAMTRTRYRKQATLTFLAEQLMAVEGELARLPVAEQSVRRQGLEAQRDALRETIAQFDSELAQDYLAGTSIFHGFNHANPQPRPK